MTNVTISQGGRKPIYIEEDARVAAAGSTEQKVLAVLLFLMYCAYAALGRDIFVNRLNFAKGAELNDPIGAVLPQVRALLCITSMLVVTSTTGLRWALSKIAWLFLPFCALAIASSLWGADGKEVLRNAIQLTLLWLGLSMLVHRLGLLQSAKVSIHLIAIVCIASCFMALVFPSIGRHTGLEAVQFDHVGRWRGIFSHKNALGPWAGYGSVLLFTHSWLCRGSPLYWWVARISAITCLIFAGSATGVVVAGCLFGFYFFFVILGRWKLAVTLTVSAFVVMALIILITALPDQIFALVGRDSTFTGRAQIWKDAWDFYFTSPWIGNGFQSLGGPYFLAREEILYDQAIPGPESAYLCMLLDLGIVGALFFMVPYLISIRNGFEWLKHVRLEDRASIEMFLMLLFSVLIVGFTESTILISTGFDGIIIFTACFALMTTPKSPDGVLRGEFRLAKYRLPDNPKKAKGSKRAVKTSKTDEIFRRPDAEV